MKVLKNKNEGFGYVSLGMLIDRLEEKDNTMLELCDYHSDDLIEDDKYQYVLTHEDLGEGYFYFTSDQDDIRFLIDLYNKIY